jgi:uncharacterized protein (TIGR02145 family)
MKTIFNFFLLFAMSMAMVMFNSCKENEPDKPVANISLNKNTLSLIVGETETLTVTLFPENAANKTITWSSRSPAVATVTEDGLITAISAGTATITAQAGEKTTTCKVNVIYEKDGVRINNIIWATRNVDEFGKFALTPESAGKFYQWNRKKTWNATDYFVAGWDNSMPSGTEWTKANDPCPQGWRVPTREELTSLHNFYSIETTQNDINGRLFGTAPNQIFLPAAGYRYYLIGSLNHVGYWSGHYWSSRQYNSDFAQYLSFDSDYVNMGATLRAHGLSVRCVVE